MKKTLAYINSMCFADTDLTVLRYLAEAYRIIWYPIYKSEEPIRFSKKELETYARKNGIEIHIYEKSIRDRSLKNFIYFKRLLEDVAQKNPDIIYTCHEHHAFIWNIFHMFDKAKIIYGLHDVEVHSNKKFGWIAQKGKEYAIRHSHNLVTFSKGQQRLLNERYHRDATMVGMSSKNYGESTKSLPNIGDGVKLLFFGGIHYYKGLDLLISALEELYDEGIRNIYLSIYANGKEWENCEPLIKHKQMFNNNIRFIENSELPDLFATHHFLVLPYRNVTNSGPLMIAVNYAKPICAPSIGCFLDIYNPSQGVLYEQGKLKEAIRHIASINEKQYGVMCKNCIELKESYSEENIAKKYLQLFREYEAHA